MINIALREYPDLRFICGDMRELDIDHTFDSVIITGRSFSYLTEDNEVNDTLRGINNILRKNGILIFDNFNSYKIFEDITEITEQKIELENKTITRQNRSVRSEKNPHLWEWEATYIVEKGGKKQEYKDRATLRAFGSDELINLLIDTI